MKRIILSILCALSINALAQIEPSVTYEGGDLYFVPSHLTAKGVSFLYSYKSDIESGKTWFTIFDDNVTVVKQAEIEPEVLNYKFRIVTSKRRFLVKQEGGTTRSSSMEDGVFLGNWSVTSDVTEDHTNLNYYVEGPEVYEDNNTYHSRNLYLSQTLFNDDDDFEFLRPHCEIMPITYCAADDPSSNIATFVPYVIGGEPCDEYSFDGYDSELGGYVYTLVRYKYYGGVKETGLDIISLDGTVKKTIEGITGLGTVVAINGNYYVSAYDNNTAKYGLYKIATATTALSRVADITSKTNNNITYNLSGMRVKPDTKGIFIRNGQKIVNK